LCKIKVKLIGFNSSMREFVPQLPVSEHVVVNEFKMIVPRAVKPVTNFEYSPHPIFLKSKDIIRIALRVSGRSSLLGSALGKSECNVVDRVRSVTLNGDDNAATLVKGTQDSVRGKILSKLEIMLRRLGLSTGSLNIFLNDLIPC